jgi:hypothetical protein
MKATAKLLLGGALLLGGCQGPSGETHNQPAPFKLNPSRSVEITPADDEFTQHRDSPEAVGRSRRRPESGTPTEFSEREVFALPKLTVSRKGLLNFGLSVVTNAEVARGGAIEWMRVGVVLPGSPAARQGLFTGIEILALDNIPIASLTREEMLHLLFERESGEQLRLLVYSRHFGALPRFVTLGQGPPRPAARP